MIDKEAYDWYGEQIAELKDDLSIYEQGYVEFIKEPYTRREFKDIICQTKNLIEYCYKRRAYIEKGDDMTKKQALAECILLNEELLKKKNLSRSVRRILKEVVKDQKNT